MRSLGNDIHIMAVIAPLALTLPISFTLTLTLPLLLTCMAMAVIAPLASNCTSTTGSSMSKLRTQRILARLHVDTTLASLTRTASGCGIRVRGGVGWGR